MSWKTAASCSTARLSACAGTRTCRNSISAARAASEEAIATSSNIAAAGDGMAELEIDGLTLRFGGLTVLDCVSGIYRGEGEIRFRGNHIAGREPHEIARLGLARTFQHGELFPQMSVLENLLTGRHTRIRTNPVTEMLFLPSVRREEVRHREAIERIIDLVELERYRRAPVDGLPFGIQKLVGFARALALEPTILMLDEPSAGLNRDEREDLARFILRIKHELGVTMIWIEHDLQMVADLADRIHVLDYGRTLAEGVPGDVLKHPRVIAAYIGTAGLVT